MHERHDIGARFSHICPFRHRTRPHHDPRPIHHASPRAPGSSQGVASARAVVDRTGRGVERHRHRPAAFRLGKHPSHARVGNTTRGPARPLLRFEAAVGAGHFSPSARVSPGSSRHREEPLGRSIIVRVTFARAGRPTCARLQVGRFSFVRGVVRRTGCMQTRLSGDPCSCSRHHLPCAWRAESLSTITCAQRLRVTRGARVRSPRHPSPTRRRACAHHGRMHARRSANP